MACPASFCQSHVVFAAVELQAAGEVLQACIAGVLLCKGALSLGG